MAANAELRASREALIRDHVAAENRHDPPAVAATFTNARYDVPAMGPAGTAIGAAAVEGLLAGMFSAFPDWHAEPGPLRHTGDGVFVEVRMTGTQKGPFVGVPPTGRPIDVAVVCIFEFDGERMIGEKVYFDAATILQQLGALPGGPA